MRHNNWQNTHMRSGWTLEQELSGLVHAGQCHEQLYRMWGRWLDLFDIVWYLFTAIGFPPGGSGRYTCTQKLVRDSTKGETVHKYKYQNTDYTKYKTKIQKRNKHKKTITICESSNWWGEITTAGFGWNGNQTSGIFLDLLSQ